MRRSQIPFDMFDVERSAAEAKRMQKVGSLYHRGQELAWDGREVLPALIAKHGGIDLGRRVVHSMVPGGSMSTSKFSRKRLTIM